MARTVDPQRHEQRRLQIIDAALTCFAARGYDGTSTAALCREAGIGLSVVPPVRMSEGELVSSTAIREYLRLGDRAGAEKMLNRTLSAREEQLLGGKDQ